MGYGVRTYIDAGKITDQLLATLRGVVTTNLQQAHADAVEAITGGAKSGRIYKRKGKTHQASAPGQAPASETGDLAGSFKTEIKTSARGVSGILTTRDKGAFPLEFGSKSRAARPFMGPAIDKIRPTFRNQVAEAIKELK